MNSLLLSMIEASGASQLDHMDPSSETEKPIKAVTTMKITPALARQCELVIEAKYFEQGRLMVRTHWNFDTRERLKSQLYHVVEDEYPTFLFDLD